MLAKSITSSVDRDFSRSEEVGGNPHIYFFNYLLYIFRIEKFIGKKRRDMRERERRILRGEMWATHVLQHANTSSTGV